LAACSPKPAASQSSFERAPEETAKPSQPATHNQFAEGEASGTFTARGETVALKYAYAARSTRFGKDSIIVLLTDRPIPKDALADELKSQTKLYAGEIRGLEYAIDKDGFWVMYHPAGYQESSPSPLRQFSLQNGVVKGLDEGGDLSAGKYQRSVSFTAHLQGEKQ
jgi:hypothetical protein